MALRYKNCVGADWLVAAIGEGRSGRAVGYFMSLFSCLPFIAAFPCRGLIDVRQLFHPFRGDGFVLFVVTVVRPAF